VIADAEQAPQAVGQHDELGIDVRPVDAEQLDPELMELAIAAFWGRSWRNMGPMYHIRRSWL
jgi:hypothetical protein